jgi:hypothetical protein
VLRRTLATAVLLLLGGMTVHVQSPPAAKPAAKPAPKPAAKAEAPLPTAQETKEFNLLAYAELLRSDVRAQKVAIITEVMGFTEAEDKAFWPIYREYDLEMSRLGDERVALIGQYASKYANLTDPDAESLARTAMDLETRRQGARAKCYERVKAATSPRTALRFLQVEHQLQLLIDLQIAAALPIAK